METLIWEPDWNTKTYNQERPFSCTSKNNNRFIRKESKRVGLIYQLFLNKQHYDLIKESIQAKQWCFFENSIVHFYGGNYIYSEGSDFFDYACNLIQTQIKWEN